MKKTLFIAFTLLTLATLLASCLSKDSDYDYYRKLRDDGNEKYECFATVHAIKSSSGDITGYWFDYNGYRYTPANNPISEQYSPIDEYGRSLDGCRVYLVYEAADAEKNKDKEITLVGVRDIPTNDLKEVDSYEETEYYGNDPLSINTYNMSADGRYLDLVLAVKGTAVSSFNLIYNKEAQASAGVNLLFDLKHDKHQSADENHEWQTFISYRIPDEFNARKLGKDNTVVNYTAEGGSKASLFIPTL